MFVFFLLSVLPIHVQTAFAQPRHFTDLAKTALDAIDRGAVDLPPSLLTSDILSRTISGNDIDFPSNQYDLPPSKTTANTAHKSLRGPLIPQSIQVGGSKRLNPKAPIHVAQVSPKEKMDQAWETFTKNKQNKIPTLEEAPSRASNLAKLKRKSIPLPSKIEYKTPQELSTNAMSEYDEQARKNAHRKRTSFKSDTVAVAAAAGVYTPQAQHFGFKDPLEFVDSFDPFHDNGNDVEGSTVPKLRPSPSRSMSPPLPGGLSKSGSSESLSNQILDSQPVYQYTKIGASTSASSPSNADRGIFGTSDSNVQQQIVSNDPNNNGPPSSSQPMGRSAVSQSESDLAMSQFMTQRSSSNPVATNVAVGPVR